MATTKKAAKQVQVIARYAHKTQSKLNGIVTYAVRSSNGKDIYCTTLIEGKASGCGCKSRKPCYHMTQLEALEATRTVVVVATPVAIKPAYMMSEAVREKLAATAKPAPVVVEPVAEAPKQADIIVSLGKKERYDYVGEITAKAENKQNMLAEIREIQERAIAQQVAQTPDMMKAALTSNRAFSILR